MKNHLLSYCKAIGLLILLAVSPISLASGSLTVAIDDRAAYDGHFTGCWWDHCKDKARELEPLLARLINEELKKGIDGELRTASPDAIHDGLRIRIRAKVGGSGRGYASVAVGLVSFGTAPVESTVRYAITYETFERGTITRTAQHAFKVSRKDSIFVNQERYVREAAKEIVAGARKHLGS